MNGGTDEWRYGGYNTNNCDGTTGGPVYSPWAKYPINVGDTPFSTAHQVSVTAHAI